MQPSPRRENRNRGGAAAKHGRAVIDIGRERGREGNPLRLASDHAHAHRRRQRNVTVQVGFDLAGRKRRGHATRRGRYSPAGFAGSAVVDSPGGSGAGSSATAAGEGSVSTGAGAAAASEDDAAGTSGKFS